MEAVMRIVSWNCHYGFTPEKAQAIDVFGTDILVIQECTRTDFDREELKCFLPNFHCDGIDSNLGVAVFSKEFEIVKGKVDGENRYVVPYNITIAKESFDLYVVWTKKPLGNKSNYHTPVYNVLDDLSSPKENIIFIGDFNTGSIQGAANAHWYEKLKSKFEEKKFLNCANGQEWAPTFFKGNSYWLDDHCFAKTKFNVISFGIGNPDYWRKYSDHCPIIVDFAL
jgi:endonuclease/exonuclease/phosphatase family metal-dependent hydrolase